MRIVYLASALADLAWMRDYYGRVFSAGRARARQRVRATEKLLVEHPFAGHPSEVDGVRELAITGTPFSFIYRVKSNRVEVLRVWDGRASRAFLGLEQ
jgi:plasmid stabilization system protein ParE